MRLVTFENCGQASPGVRIGPRIHDVSWFAPTTEEVIALLAEGIDNLDDAALAPSVAAADVALLPPLLEPGKIIKPRDLPKRAVACFFQDVACSGVLNLPFISTLRNGNRCMVSAHATSAPARVPCRMLIRT